MTEILKAWGNIDDHSDAGFKSFAEGNEEKPFDFICRNVVEHPIIASDEEIKWLSAMASFSGPQGYIMWIPASPEDFAAEYAEAPEQIKTVLQVLFREYQKTKPKDYGYIILYTE